MLVHRFAETIPAAHQGRWESETVRCFTAPWMTLPTRPRTNQSGMLAVTTGSILTIGLLHVNDFDAALSLAIANTVAADDDDNNDAVVCGDDVVHDDGDDDDDGDGDDDGDDDDDDDNDDDDDDDDADALLRLLLLMMMMMLLLRLLLIPPWTFWPAGPLLGVSPLNPAMPRRLVVLLSA